MTPGSTSYENILEVENQGSQLSRFFKILAPVQITLESCTGLGEIDQYSIQMFSPNGCWLHENSMDALFRALSSRPLQIRIAAELYNHIGANGQTSYTNNGITRVWESSDVAQSLLNEVVPRVGVIG